MCMYLVFFFFFFGMLGEKMANKHRTTLCVCGESFGFFLVWFFFFFWFFETGFLCIALAVLELTL